MSSPLLKKSPEMLKSSGRATTNPCCSNGEVSCFIIINSFAIQFKKSKIFYGMFLLRYKDLATQQWSVSDRETAQQTSARQEYEIDLQSDSSNESDTVSVDIKH